jgi:hypothetical protein
VIKLASSILLIFGIGIGAFALPRVTRKPPTAASFMPENRLHLQDGMLRSTNGITEELFNQVIDQVIALYQPVVALHGAKLVAEKKWDDSTVNAYASQSGNVWTVAMFGGLARRPEITLDGFALVICHELGHHLGGYAFKGDRWASAEGQSDYFSTQVCARSLWGFQDGTNNQWHRFARMADTVKSKCDEAWSGENARGWCYRAAAAGKSLATLLSALGGGAVPSFDTPDQKVVSQTDTDHPEGQCRLDTYFAGALCTKTFDLHEIPGKVGGVGQSTVAAEMAAAKVTCFQEDGFKAGYRPACWFKSLRSSGLRR